MPDSKIQDIFYDRHVAFFKKKLEFIMSESNLSNDQRILLFSEIAVIALVKARQLIDSLPQNEANGFLEMMNESLIEFITEESIIPNISGVQLSLDDVLK